VTTEASHEGAGYSCDRNKGTGGEGKSLSANPIHLFYLLFNSAFLYRKVSGISCCCSSLPLRSQYRRSRVSLLCLIAGVCISVSGDCSSGLYFDLLYTAFVINCCFSHVAMSTYMTQARFLGVGKGKVGIVHFGSFSVNRARLGN